MIRLKVNNNKSHKYYLLKNKSEYENIDYYTISQNKTNKNVSIETCTREYNNSEYSYIKLNVKEIQLPNEIFDIVVDAGHGGSDKGNTNSGHTEADITLDYANLLKEKLEKFGLKVKLTRDNSNTDSYSEKSTYDENGRITIACKSKAKYMLSLHVNNGNSDFSGVEIYTPSRCNLNFAKNLASNIVKNTSLEYSNVGKNKKFDGVYTNNFSNTEIYTYEQNAKKKGYENYSITTDTPFLYTIREVGGIATNAFIDGRNTSYSANKYYNSNQGIECYQIELGYIKNDLEKILNEKENYINAIADSLCEEINK